MKPGKKGKEEGKDEMKRFIRIVLGLLGVVGVAGGVYVYLVFFEQEKPAIQILPDAKHLGKELILKVQDQKSGVAELQVDVIQAGRTINILSEKFPKKTLLVEKTIPMRPLPQGLRDGEAQIKVSAKDHSWNWGNPVSAEKAVVLDTTPPQLSVLGTLHYANQGGTGVITYQVSEEVPRTGVQVGETFFPGYAVAQGRYVAYFAVPLDASSKTPTVALAEDPAGNRTQTGFRLNIKPKAFKKDKIEISDSFLQNLLPYFTSKDPSLKGTPLEIFLAVNRKQREADHQETQKISKETAPKPLWSGIFLRLPNSKPMASFAQDRTYHYGGKEVDRQIHWGVDLASLAQSPVPAANSGIVVFAGPLGIYGNTVIIDHGCGLFSLYSHLSKLETEVKREVKKGDTLGRTGATGMAGGDHLHYAMMVHGIFVNPLEWWDEHWIRDNVDLKMKWFDAPPKAEPSRQAAQETKPKAKTKKPARKAARP
ncbi:MAG: peptidase, family [Deltaproteobacteria bacterium]|nr:peptidase, family [Deltaproteobacteria bacterium]